MLYLGKNDNQLIYATIYIYNNITTKIQQLH